MNASAPVWRCDHCGHPSERIYPINREWWCPTCIRNALTEEAAS